MPVTMRPLTPAVPPAHPWIVENLLPAAEVVFLDGVSGVGKSIFCAHLASSFSGVEGRDSLHRILYISSKRQAEERDDHLRKQRGNLGIMVEAPFITEKSSFGMPEPMVPLRLLDHIRDQLNAQLVLFVIIDDLEELLAPAGPIELAMYENFWSELQEMARSFHTTFIIPRRRGLHEHRNYGLYTRTGNDAARLILAMQYHPHDPNQRVVTVAKNLRGPAAIQWLLQFDAGGRLFARKAEAHQVVNPSNTLRTWTPDISEARDDISFMTMLVEKTNGQPATKETLLEHAREAGYSENRFRHAMSRLKLRQTRQGNTHLYHPNCEMLNILRAIQRQPQEDQASNTARTPPPHDVSRPAHTRATSAAA
ncbi:MAG: AAA family ATPase [Gemmatales bacterium]